MEESNASQSPATPEPPHPAREPGRSDLLERLAFLRNRFILGGLSLLVVLLLITIVLVALGSDDDGPEEISAAGETTPVAASTVDLETGLNGRMLATATMRIGPDITYAILGTIPSGAQVSVIGRNADASWLQVVYPPGSQLRGWVPKEAVTLAGDVSELAVAGPGEGPSVPFPTSAPPVAFFTATPLPALPTIAATPTEEPRPTPGATATARPTDTPRPLTPTPPVPTATPPVPPTATPEGP